VPEAVAQYAQDQRQEAQQPDACQADDGAQRVHEGLERYRHEHQRERQDEAHAHLRRGRDPQGAILNRRRVAAAQQCAGRQLILQQHLTHVGKSRFDARQQQQDGEGDPDHPHPQLVGQCTDDREQPRDSQALHQEQAHRDLDHDDDQRGYIGGLEDADEAGTADHLGHGPRDQREVDRGAADGHQQHHGGNEELHQRRGRQHRQRLVFAFDDLLVFLHVPIDTHRARQQALDLLVDIGQ
jgi:hypothetical protein